MSVLDGMTPESSRKLVSGFRVEDVMGHPVLRNTALTLETEWSCEALLALAALGAKVVGCKEVRETRWVCVRCGPGVAADEDGCCSTCGRYCQVTDGRVIVLEADHE